ncbi:iron-sulfur protein [Rhodobacter sp. TJ_12]|uniref:4Fe-4S dicluster domain-containing protein n=1 Tax=Rhodobacter sp. TJ_12 TaxID=2029399 RepID=UPI001CBB9518|nr:4Fe-4S dicluster domain-containing protein [Rhodobacter sp. TJ_12]MBZ4021535.1 iron-sulfur protein [Rhodobacter sp. TJ_12]
MPHIPENAIIHTDPDRCLGCHSCEIACALAHSGGQDIVSATAGRVPLHPRNIVVSFEGATMPMQCRQCEDAPCTQVCPTNACRQADGQIEIVEQHCIGCKLCVMVCPFGAISVRAQADAAPDPDGLTNRGVALKCDLCKSWRAETGKEAPACVEACPTKAIELVDMAKYRDALRKARARELAQSHRSLRLNF